MSDVGAVHAHVIRCGCGLLYMRTSVGVGVDVGRDTRGGEGWGTVLRVHPIGVHIGVHQGLGSINQSMVYIMQGAKQDSSLAKVAACTAPTSTSRTALQSASTRVTEGGISEVACNHVTGEALKPARVVGCGGLERVWSMRHHDGHYGGLTRRI